MVNIDRVYQKVLILANKEQRGYITPQEFNSFANQAQMEIFEQYFYDIEQWGRKPGNEYEYSDMVTNIEEKIGKFQVNDASFAGTVSGGLDLSQGDIYKLGTIRVKYSNQGGGGYNRAEQLTVAEFDLYEKSPLTKGTPKRPYYTLQARSISQRTLAAKFSPGLGSGDNALLSYIRQPLNVSWGYVVVQGTALFDPSLNKTQNFELHLSEEVELVYKILKLAGVTIQNNDIVQMAQAAETAQIQQEKQ